MNLVENPAFQQTQQMKVLEALNPKQRARLQSYMRDGGLSFEDAHAAMLLTDPPMRYAVRLIIEPLYVNAPKGRRLTRRQRRRQNR